MFLLSDVSVDGSNRYFITDLYFPKRYHFLVEFLSSSCRGVSSELGTVDLNKKLAGRVAKEGT